MLDLSFGCGRRAINVTHDLRISTHDLQRQAGPGRTGLKAGPSTPGQRRCPRRLRGIAHLEAELKDP